MNLLDSPGDDIIDGGYVRWLLVQGFTERDEDAMTHSTYELLAREDADGRQLDTDCGPN